MGIRVFFQIAKGTDAPLYLSFKAFKLMNAEDASSLDKRLQKMMHAFEARNAENNNESAKTEIDWICVNS